MCPIVDTLGSVAFMSSHMSHLECWHLYPAKVKNMCTAVIRILYLRGASIRRNIRGISKGLNVQNMRLNQPESI